MKCNSDDLLNMIFSQVESKFKLNGFITTKQHFSPNEQFSFIEKAKS